MCAHSCPFRGCRMAPPREALVACACWTASSLAMNVVNKEVAVRFGGSANEVVCVQMLVTTVVQLPGARLERGWRRWAVVVPPLFALMLTTSMWALSCVSIGSFVVARNATPLLTFALEACHGREPVTATRLCLLLGLLAGSLLYERANLRFDGLGTAYLALNMVAGALERYAQQRMLGDPAMECSTATLSMLNNGVAAALLAPALLATEPHKVAGVAAWPRSHSLADNAMLASSCAVATLLSRAGLWAQSLVSATDFLVLGCVSKVALIGLGMAVYRDSHSLASVLAVALSVGSGLGFALRGRIEDRLRRFEIEARQATSCEDFTDEQEMSSFLLSWRRG